MLKALEGLVKVSRRDERVIANRLRCMRCGHPLGQPGQAPAVKRSLEFGQAAVLVHSQCPRGR